MVDQIVKIDMVVKLDILKSHEFLYWIYVRLLHEMKIRRLKSPQSKKSFEHSIVQMDIHGAKTMVYSWLKYAKKIFTKKMIVKD